MENHTKIFMTACIFMLSIAVILPLSSITSMRFVLQRDCDNPNYIPKNLTSLEFFVTSLAINPISIQIMSTMSEYDRQRQEERDELAEQAYEEHKQQGTRCCKA